MTSQNAHGRLVYYDLRDQVFEDVFLDEPI